VTDSARRQEWIGVHGDRHRLLLALDGGEVRLLREFIVAWMPLIRVRVARSIGRHRSFSRDPRQEVEDISQEVFTLLFAEGAKVLRSWDPDRGLSLANFVGLVAERHTSAIMSNRRRSPWTESPAMSDDFDTYLGSDDRSMALESKDFLLTLLDHVEEVLTPRGLELFERIVMREESIEEVCAATGMSVAAAYGWRKRLLKVARMIGTELLEKVSCSRIPVARDISACHTVQRSR
jgi:hypothetical protein